MNEVLQPFPHLYPDIEDWPIYKLSEDRRRFVHEIEEFTRGRILEAPTAEVTDLLARTIYQERVRIKEEPWKVDPPNERQFWKKIRRKLITHSLDKPGQVARQNNAEILQTILHRYAEEIVGTFNKKTFLFARRFLTFFFNHLLSRIAKLRVFRSGRKNLSRHFQVRGEVEQVRALFRKGTVVIVPTHFSNLDSILIGYVIDAFVGLPSFSYGAGLNLYNTGYTAYFMNRLGAYRVDRRKKNPIYLETLKAMSMLSIKRGTNSLFFPGGTRSRSGALEDKLKLGLLGTAVEAQRALAQDGKSDKIFIVPLILSYPFVLEAQFLIDQHLRQMGKERYIRGRDEFYSVRRLVKFAWQILTEGNDITVSFGQPMDVLGNPVDAEGDSYDKYGNRIEVAEYFRSAEGIRQNLQRESEYTKILAGRIVERYYKDNVVLSSHLVAFAAFEILTRENRELDIYGILRLPTDDYVFPSDLLYRVVEQLQHTLRHMESAGRIKLAPQIDWPVEDLIRDGVSRLGTYHINKPLKYNKQGMVVSESFKVLFYYHNRLENYGLQNRIVWKEVPKDLPESAKLASVK
jgi:glycerol-3-phosphate O-acyltransferase